MENYIEPREIIKWFEKNINNEEELKKYGYSKKASEWEIKQGRHFLGLELRDILFLIKDVAKYIKEIDPNYAPEYTIYKEERYSDDESYYHIQGDKYRVYKSFMGLFIKKKETFKETVGELKPETLKNLLGEDTSNYMKEDSNLPASLKESSIKDIEDSIFNKHREIEALKGDLEAEIKKKEEEFAIQISKMKLAMAEKMSEAYSKMLQSKNEVANMESYFYRYMSYKGYTFKLKNLCSGKYGEGSLVIWQKLRYLDEELPRLCALDSLGANIDFNSFTSFEKLVATNKSVRDFFLPSQKCVVAFQLSRKSTKSCGHFMTASKVEGSGRDAKVKVWLEYIETAYNLANWNKLGLFIRDGENVHVAWLDADRISIIGESLFVTNASTDSEIKSNFKELKDVESYNDKDKGSVALENFKIMEANNSEGIKIYNKYMSRVYVVDILQGILDNAEGIVSLPKEQSILRALTEGSYKDAIFNNADGYIEDLKWKNFKEVYEDFKLKDEDIKYGCDVYVLVNDGGDSRGRINAYVNRTSGSRLVRGITKINMIDFEDTYYFYKKVDKSNFKLLNTIVENNVEKNCYILTGLDRETYNNRINLEIIYKDGKVDIIYSSELYKSKDGSLSTYYRSGWENRVYAYMIKDFDNVESLNFYFVIQHTGENRKVEEPTEPRYSKKNNVWSYEEGTYVKEQLNKVYEDYMYYVRNYKLSDFIEDKSKRKREYYFYVSCENSWAETKSNVLVERREFITLKNIRNEHIDYMINHKFVLPRFSDFASSLEAYLQIKDYLKERDKK